MFRRGTRKPVGIHGGKGSKDPVTAMLLGLRLLSSISSALLAPGKLPELSSVGFHPRPNGPASPQEAEANRSGGDPLVSRDLVRRQAAQLLLKEHPIAGRTELEDLRRIERSQINSDVGKDLGQILVTSFHLASTAMVVDGYGDDPA
jgi:hypothetical protein